MRVRRNEAEEGAKEDADKQAKHDCFLPCTGVKRRPCDEARRIKLMRKEVGRQERDGVSDSHHEALCHRSLVADKRGSSA